MKHKNPMIFKLISVVLISFLSFSTNAQKLPNVQKFSVWAPAAIKIDGMATEWNDQYQAYNNATDIYYTVSNDNENLYLTVKVKYNNSMQKIIQGGISLTLNHTLNKRDIAPISITYPVLVAGTERGVVINALTATMMLMRDDTKKFDNSLERLNSIFAVKSKLINVVGIENMSDEDISVYNEQGIKAVSRFDKPFAYVYELAIPLKYLALPNIGTDGFAYHIKVNVDRNEHKGTNSPMPIVNINPNLPPPPPPNQASISATDFWGEYTLAKKP